MSSQRESSPAESDVFHDASEISSRKVDAGDHGMMDQGNDGETIPDSESERDDVEHTPPDQHHGVYGTSNNDRDNAVFGESHDEEMEDAINPRLANSRQNTPSVLDGNANDQTQRHASHEMDMPDHPGWDHQPDCSGSPGASTPARSVSPEESSEDSAVEGSNEDNDSASSNDEDADDTESGQGDKEAVDSSGDEDDISVVEVDASNWIQEADPVQTGKEMDKELRRHHILHAKARDLMPHSLPRHRYWVAILTHLVQPKDARKEKDFLWIKANRVSSSAGRWERRLCFLVMC